MNVQRCVIGNWKLNPATKSVAHELAQGLSGIACDAVRVGCTPSFTHLSTVAGVLAGTPIWVGAQDICAYTQSTGAYTGDVSAEQLSDLGVGFVIIGHSERRNYYREDHSLLVEKMKQAFAADLSVVFCIGETKEQYQANQTLSVLDDQLSVLQTFRVPRGKLIIAYEPIWAIGTGLTPTTQEVIATHAHIKSVLASYHFEGVSVLYGGSVNEQNAAEFAQAEGVDGALVGGASLKLDTFAQIIAAFESAS